MEILLWLAPTAVVTVVAMLWVGWRGREQRAVDREEAARRLGAALERAERRQASVRRPGSDRTTDRSSGVAIRPSRSRPVALPPGKGQDRAGGDVPDRRTA